MKGLQLVRDAMANNIRRIELHLLCGIVVLATASPAGSTEILRLAATTSTANSGLLAYVLPRFTADSGIPVRPVAVGTGDALRLGRQGEVDVVLVHDPDAEEEFLNSGFGVDRRPVMYDDYVIVGPSPDPAKIKGLRDATEAMKHIRAAGGAFVSRGDRSGTHARELALWRAADISPKRWNGYLLARQGMGNALLMADEKRAYTLSDRGTLLAYPGYSHFAILVEGDPRLRNVYSVMAVSPTKHPGLNYEGASRLIAWLTSDTGRAAIASFRVRNQQLFFVPER